MTMEPFLLGEWSMCNHSPKRNGLKGAPRDVKLGVRARPRTFQRMVHMDSRSILQENPKLSQKISQKLLRDSPRFHKLAARLSQTPPRNSQSFLEFAPGFQQTRPAFGGLAPKKTITILRNPRKMCGKTCVFASWLKFKAKNVKKTSKSRKMIPKGHPRAPHSRPRGSQVTPR